MWHMQITPKLKTFIWEHGKLLANVQRQIRNLTTHCPICPAEPETLEHLLISAARLMYANEFKGQIHVSWSYLVFGVFYNHLVLMEMALQTCFL